MATVSIADILELPVAERLRLIEEIWDSVVECPEAVPLTDTQRAELQRRLAEYEADPTSGSPWPEVKARLLNR
jgi:putative addiction module component (TIGR02574 family)